MDLGLVVLEGKDLTEAKIEIELGCLFRFQHLSKGVVVGQQQSMKH